jgi:predicted phosphoribosyltransferase
MIYRDRIEAGKRLAVELTDYANRPDVLVLALPRGGVPVAYEVACALHAPLDIFLVRKLGVPGHEELAMGAQRSGRRAKHRRLTPSGCKERITYVNARNSAR